MRRVSKAQAAAIEASARGSSKRKASAKASYAESDDAGVEDTAKSTAKPEPVPQAENGQTEEKDVKTDAGDESDEAESFEVEAILGSRSRHGKMQFKIRWKNYGPADDTWEDEENVDSPELIAAFLKGDPVDSKVKKAVPKSKNQAKKRGAESSPKPKPAKKMKSDNGADDKSEWEVSKIVDYVNLKDGTRQFLVHWKGFSSKENTWEPEANLNCPDLIEKFLAAESEREESTRETREVRKQVYKYNPELSKRRSHRSSTIKRISYHDLE